MFFDHKSEDRKRQREKKWLELEINLEKLDREYQELIKETELNPEDIHTFVSEATNFSEPIWERLQNEKKKLEEKLNRSLNMVTDAKKTKQTLSERAAVRQDWIFVR